MKRKFTEMKALIKKAIIDLGERKQQGYASDIFDNYFKEHVVKMKTVFADKLDQIEDEYLYDLCCLLEKYGEPMRVIKQIEGVVNQCNSEGFRTYNQQLC